MKSTDNTPSTPAGSYAWCTWHKGYSSSTRLVRIIEQGSGPGAGLNACAPCREAYKLVPVTDQP